MIQVCSECFKIYKLSTYIKTKDGYKSVTDEVLPCPKLGCKGELYECDELFAPIISTLNKKGYRTLYSCSGHIKADYCVTYNPRYKKIYRNHPIESYINFEEGIELPCIPKGYKMDKINKDNKNITIRKRFNEKKRPKTLLRELMNNAFEVLEWAETLDVHK